MESSTIKHFSLISGIIAHNFLDTLIKHTNSSYYQAFEIVNDLAFAIYTNLEEDLDALDNIDYLDSVIMETKKILLTKYRINLISYAP